MDSGGSKEPYVLDGSPDPPCEGAILTGNVLSAGKCLAERARSAILQRNPSFGETPDQLHFSYHLFELAAVNNYDNIRISI